MVDDENRIRLLELASAPSVAASWCMRGETNPAKLLAFFAALGAEVRGSGAIYITGGASALLHGWRATTIDVDLKPDPEPAGLFEAIALLKEQIDINIELAAPDHFIPALPGWRERSPFIQRFGSLDFFHYDFYSQALSKIERGHARDYLDVRAMAARRLITPGELRRHFRIIEPDLIRYPAIDPATFRAAVDHFCAAFLPEPAAEDSSSL